MIILLSVLLTIAICALAGCAFIINTCFNKIQTYEDWIVDYDKTIRASYNKLKQIDDKQMFQKDDDVGFIFSQILSIIESLKDKTK